MSLKSIFYNKKIILTGHTGFKGSWLSMWLSALGAKVVGVALVPQTEPSHFKIAKMEGILDDHCLDIRDGEVLKSLVLRTQPDFVFHLAAQSLVRQAYVDPVETYQTNVMGTLNLLEALRDLEKSCTAVLITSDKCYDNVEWVWGYRETDRLGGSDPYSSSKGAAELVIRSHIRSFFPRNGTVRIAIGRAGNVIGGGDWANDRIVPDCVRSWAKNKTVQLRNPKPTRPWQHVLEPLSGYLTLASKLNQMPELHGEPFNFGPPAHQNHTVLELVQLMSQDWDQVRWEDIPNTLDQPYESGLLKLNCDKALNYLSWQPVMNFEESVRVTTKWYKSYYAHPSDISEVTLNQIEEYILLASERGMSWSK